MTNIQVLRLKQTAKTIRKEFGISHTKALDLVATKKGFGNWSLLAKYFNNAKRDKGEESDSVAEFGLSADDAKLVASWKALYEILDKQKSFEKYRVPSYFVESMSSDDHRAMLASMYVDFISADIPVNNVTIEELWRLLMGSPLHRLNVKINIIQGLIDPSPIYPHESKNGRIYNLIKEKKRFTWKYAKKRERMAERLYEALSNGEMIDVLDIEGAQKIANGDQQYSLLPLFAISARALKYDEYFSRDGVYTRQELERLAIAVEKLSQNMPEEAVAWHYLAVALGSDLRRYEESEMACRKALSLDQEKGAIWYYYGELLKKTKRYAEADDAYRKALAIAPENQYFIYGLLRLFKARCDLESFEKLSFELLELNKNQDSLWWHLGDIYYKNKLLEKAEHACRQSKAFKNRICAQTRLITILVELGKYDEANQLRREAKEEVWIGDINDPEFVQWAEENFM